MYIDFEGDGPVSFRPHAKAEAEGFVKPALKATGRVLGAGLGSMILAPVAGIISAIRLGVPSAEMEQPLAFGIPSFNKSGSKVPSKPKWTPGGLKEANKTLEEIMSVPGKLIVTEEEVKSLEYINKPFELAGTAGEYAGKKANEGLKELGFEDTYLEPLFATYGEAALIFGLPGVIKKIKASNAYRMMTIKERGLVIQSLADTVKKNPNMTEGQIIRKFNNKTWRDETKRTFKKEEIIPVKPKAPANIQPEAKPIVAKQPKSEIAKTVQQEIIKERTASPLDILEQRVKEIADNKIDFEKPMEIGEPAKQVGEPVKEPAKSEFDNFRTQMKEKYGENHLFEQTPEEARKDANLITKARDEILTEYKKNYGNKPIVLTNDAGTKGVVISLSSKHPGKYQITDWDERGFSGDRTYDTEKEAIVDAWQDNKRVANPEAFERASKTEAFKEGNKAADEVQKWNEKSWKRSQEKKEIIPIKPKEIAPEKPEMDTISKDLNVKYDGEFAGVGHSWTDLETKGSFTTEKIDVNEVRKSVDKVRESFKKVETPEMVEKKEPPIPEAKEPWDYLDLTHPDSITYNRGGIGGDFSGGENLSAAQKKEYHKVWIDRLNKELKAERGVEVRDKGIQWANKNAQYFKMKGIKNLLERRRSHEQALLDIKKYPGLYAPTKPEAKKPAP
ncbi:MAG TPA: hypothetical protein VMW81_02270, partial [Nitrospinota bacterium]|nr:hypothetical protein [Nitrospinota bacterium]